VVENRLYSKYTRRGIERSLEANKEKVFFNHSANAISSEGAIYYTWEQKKLSLMNE